MPIVVVHVLLVLKILPVSSIYFQLKLEEDRQEILKVFLAFDLEVCSSLWWLEEHTFPFGTFVPRTSWWLSTKDSGLKLDYVQ